MAASMLRALFIMLVASYTNALIVGTRPAMVPKVQLRAQEAPPPPPKGKLGATVDQDGKSNVWVRYSPRVRRATRAPLRDDSAFTVHTQAHFVPPTTTFTTTTTATTTKLPPPPPHPRAHTHAKPRLHPHPHPLCQAVEPSMKVDKEDKGLLAFAPVALVAVAAVAVVPLLPVLFGANPDQV